MQDNFLPLFENLVKDIRNILSRDLGETEKMEHCFKHGIAHWNTLKTKIKKEGFASDAEEIHFFKAIKPRFIGQIEYYTLRYRVLLFLPEDSKQSQQDFWVNEESRIKKIYGAHTAFFNYLKSGRRDKDDQYFLRRSNDGICAPGAKVYDLDPETATSHDWLLSVDIAYTKYEKYIESEVQKLVKPGA